MYGNGIKQTTTTTGVGALTIAAVSGYPTLSNVFPVGVLFSYTLLDSNGLFIEAGEGTLSNSTTMIRSSVSATYSGTTYVKEGATASSLTGTTTIICTPNASTLASSPQTVDSFNSGVGRYIASSGTTNLRANYTLGASMFYIPFQSDFGVVANSLAINVVTAVAGNAVMGIYAQGSQGQPGKQLAITAPFSVGTTGWKKPALVSNLAISPGFYYVSLDCTVAITVTANDSSAYNTQAGPNILGFSGDSFSPILFRYGGAASPTDASTIVTSGAATHTPAILIGIV